MELKIEVSRLRDWNTKARPRRSNATLWLKIEVSRLRDWNVHSGNHITLTPDLLKIEVSRLRDWNKSASKLPTMSTPLKIEVSRLRDWNGDVEVVVTGTLEVENRSLSITRLKLFTYIPLHQTPVRKVENRSLSITRLKHDNKRLKCRSRQ